MGTHTEKYGVNYEKAVTCVIKDPDAMLAFYDFPADHWDHLRTGNPIENVFAAVRHRTVRTKGALSQKSAKLMVFKLVQAAAKTWHRLKGATQLPRIILGVTVADGVATKDADNRAALSKIGHSSKDGGGENGADHCPYHPSSFSACRAVSCM
jgi:putative transposase